MHMMHYKPNREGKYEDSQRDLIKKYIEMGVTRLGTSSGVALVTSGFSDSKGY